MATGVQLAIDVAMVTSTTQRQRQRSMASGYKTASVLDAQHSKWINSVSDDKAGIYAISPCVALSDLTADGDSKLIVAHVGGKFNMGLKVFKGVTLQSDSVLADPPTALVAFTNEQSSLPAIAVASGPSLLIYKNLRPFYKFTVPATPALAVEEEAWQQVADRNIQPTDLVVVLRNLAKEISFKRLTPQSQTLLSLKENQYVDFIEKHSQRPLVNTAAITCLSTMRRSSADNMDVVVVGTERCQVLIVDSQAFTTIATIQLPSVPVQIITYGVYEVDYRIFVSTRDSTIYSIKRETTQVERAIISCKNHIVGFSRMNKLLPVISSNKMLSFYTFKGRKMNSFKLESAPLWIEPFFYAPRQFSAVLVLMERQIRMYNDQYLIDIIKFDRPLRWLKFGPFGREEAAVVVGTKEGGIAVKLLRRRANLDERIESNSDPLFHNIKLNVPKKTRDFIDQTLREREQGISMNQTYQKDLFLLKHLTTTSFARLSEKSLASVGTGTKEPIDISVDVNGFGPVFRLTIRLTSSAANPMYKMWLSLFGDGSFYSFETSLIPVSVLFPAKSYTFTTLVTCNDPAKGTSEEIRVLLVREGRPTPIVTAIVEMPISEMSLLD